jgi:hypothetical protein
LALSEYIINALPTAFKGRIQRQRGIASNLFFRVTTKTNKSKSAPRIVIKNELEPLKFFILNRQMSRESIASEMVSFSANLIFGNFYLLLNLFYIWNIGTHMLILTAQEYFSNLST